MPPAIFAGAAKPSQIIDIGRIEGLNTIELKGRSIVIGATARHIDVANSPA